MSSVIFSKERFVGTLVALLWLLLLRQMVVLFLVIIIQLFSVVRHCSMMHYGIHHPPFENFSSLPGFGWECLRVDILGGGALHSVGVLNE